MNEIEKAINILNNIISDTKDVAGTEEYCEAVRLGRETLEKQIPKKPIKDRKQEIRYTSSYSCPSCGDGFTGTGIADYCYHCGQKLDWGNEDE